MADYARGDNLRALRTKRRLSQEEAAHQIGVSTKSLRTWEKGGKIRWQNAQRVAAFYDIDPDTLVSRDDPSENGDGPDALAELEAATQGLELEAVIRRLEAVAARLERIERGRRGRGAGGANG